MKGPDQNLSPRKLLLFKALAWRFALGAALTLPLTPLVLPATAQELPAKRVLIISTGSRLAPGFIIVDQQLLEALGKISSPRIEIYAENLDIVRFPEEHSQRIFSDYLTAKYANYPPDLVILVFVGNLRVPGNVLKRLFPDTPIIVAGYTEEEIRTELFDRLLSGIAQRVDAHGTLEIILRLQPAVRRVVVIGGTAAADRQMIRAVERAAGPFKGRINIDFWDNLRLTDVQERVRALPPDTAILFTRMFQDAAGQGVVSSEVGQAIGRSANVPVYVMSDASLGTGAVGGAVASVETFGKRAGELARLVLTGTDIRSLPFEILSDSVPMFDWRALQRWGISETRLPPGSVLRFKPDSIWQQYHWYIISAVIIFYVQCVMIVGLLLQRRRRCRAEAELRDSRQIMELAASAGELGLWSRDLRSDTIWANAPMRSLFGFGVNDTLRFEDMVGRVSPEDRERMLLQVEQAQPAGLPFEGEFRIVRPNGTQSWVLARGRTTGDSASAGNQRRMGVIIDITERKKAEERLQDSEENFRRLVETTSAVLWEADARTWVFTYVAPQAVKLFGYPLDQWYEKDFWISHIHPEEKEQAIETCSALSKVAEEFQFEYRMIKASGEIIWVHDIVSCQRLDGEPMRLRGVMLDISERKRGEQALQESEERFRAMADTAPVMIWMAGPDKLCTFFNKGWLDFTGRTVEQELGNGWAEGVHKEDFDRCWKTYVNAFDARRDLTMEYRLRRYDGEYRWIVDHGVPRFESDGTFLGYIGSCLDVTERKRAQDELETERSFLRQVIDIVPNFIFAKDREGRFTLANLATAEAYGTTVENLIGKTDSDFNSNFEEVEFFRRMDLEVMNTLQERFIAEERVTDANGKARWLQTVKRPIVDKDGSANQALGTSTDITQRKETELELRRQRAELAHITRISIMGELAASLAHELNQPLTAILSNAQAALRFMAVKPPDLEEVHEILKEIVEDNSRASEVIRRIRALLKKEDIEFVAVDIEGLIRDVMMLVHSDAVLHDVQISFKCNSDLPRVLGDRVQLQQVTLNLLVNAFDAVNSCPAQERQVVVRVERQGAAMLKVTVRDHGIGLSGDTLEKIFQPFFTTRSDGLGMGLAICRSIIEAHGGRLWAENNPDRGAAFCFTVPVAVGAAAMEIDEPEGARKLRQ